MTRIVSRWPRIPQLRESFTVTIHHLPVWSKSANGESNSLFISRLWLVGEGLVFNLLCLSGFTLEKENLWFSAGMMLADATSLTVTDFRMLASMLITSSESNF